MIFLFNPNHEPSFFGSGDMYLLGAKPRCDCCPTQRAFIARHIDHDRILHNSDDPAEAVEAMDSMREDGDCGVSIAEMREYLKELPDEPGD
jgi:hypothetical protein